MDINKIKEKFPEINEIYFEMENNKNVLKVEVNLTDMALVQDISKKISDFVDTIDNDESEYSLEVFSPGKEIKIEKGDLKDHVGEFVEITTNEDKKIEAKIYEEAGEINIKENIKGRMKKHSLGEIKEIKLIFKV